MNLKQADQFEIKFRRERFSINLRRSENELHFNNFRKRILLSNNSSVSLTEIGEACDPEKLMEFQFMAKTLKEAIVAKDLPDILRYLRAIAVSLAEFSDVEQAPINEFFESNLHEQVFVILRNERLLRNSAIVKEAVSIVSNATAGKRAYIEVMIHLGLFPIFYDILRDADQHCTYNVLFSLANILCEDAMFKKQFDNSNLWSVIFESIERFRFVAKIAQVSVWLFSTAISKSPYLNLNTVL